MIVALIILVAFAAAVYGIDYDLRCLRDRLQDEIGADGALESSRGSSDGATASLHAVGAGDYRPFDWETDAA